MKRDTSFIVYAISHLDFDHMTLGNEDLKFLGHHLQHAKNESESMQCEKQYGLDTVL